MLLSNPASIERSAPLLKNNAERLAALHSYSILDTPVEAAFDDITRIASLICEVPVALISLVEDERQWFKAEVGLGQRQTPIGSSMCAHAILQYDTLEIPDTMLDVRFASNPLVTGEMGLRFYAGATLRTSEGHALGTVCVMDTQPRQLSAEQRDALKALARQTMALLELRKALFAAEQMEKQLQYLMTVAGHDLRQPLQTIAMSLEIGRLKLTDPKLVSLMASGLAATMTLGQELDNLAIASRTVAGRINPARGPVSIPTLFAALDDAWRGPAERKQLRLRMLSSPRHVVLSNPDLLKSILGNLIGNAIKYTNRGRVVVGCRRFGDQLRIAVVDTGIGIDPARQAEMFGAFRKADLASEGLGLGLTIVRNAADQLGHKLRLDSRPGRGTMISLSLPLAAGDRS